MPAQLWDPDVPRERDGIRTNPFPAERVEIGAGASRSPSDAGALHAAVPLVKVNDVAGRVSRGSHLDGGVDHSRSRNTVGSPKRIASPAGSSTSSGNAAGSVTRRDTPPPPPP